MQSSAKILKQGVLEFLSRLPFGFEAGTIPAGWLCVELSDMI